MPDRYYSKGHIVFERCDGFDHCLCACLNDETAAQIVSGLRLTALNARDGGDTLNESLLFCANALPRELRAAREAGITAGSSIRAALGLGRVIDFKRITHGGAS